MARALGLSLSLPLALVLGTGSLALYGCGTLPRPPHPKPVNCYFGDPRDLQNVRRVIVMPFGQAAGVEADTFPIRATFLNELQKLGKFEVVPLPDLAEEDREMQRGLVRGRLSPEALVTLCKRYQLDGVLTGTVTSYRAYKPPHLGLKVQLMSVHSASTIWAAEGSWDSGEASTIEDLQHFSGSYEAAEESLHGWELSLIAPTRFAAFVSHRLVGTWRDAGR